MSLFDRVDGPSGQSGASMGAPTVGDEPAQRLRNDAKRACKEPKRPMLVLSGTQFGLRPVPAQAIWPLASEAAIDQSWILATRIISALVPLLGGSISSKAM